MTWVILIVFYLMTHNNMQVCAHISPSWSSPLHHWPAKVICSFPISLYPLLPLPYFSPRNLSTLEIILFICRLHCWNVNSNEMSSGKYLIHCYTPEPGTVIWHIVDIQWFFFFLNELIFLKSECMKLMKDKEIFFFFFWMWTKQTWLCYRTSEWFQEIVPEI